MPANDLNNESPLVKRAIDVLGPFLKTEIAAMMQEFKREIRQEFAAELRKQLPEIVESAQGDTLEIMMATVEAETKRQVSLTVQQAMGPVGDALNRQKQEQEAFSKKLRDFDDTIARTRDDVKAQQRAVKAKIEHVKRMGEFRADRVDKHDTDIKTNMRLIEDARSEVEELQRENAKTRDAIQELNDGIASMALDMGATSDFPLLGTKSDDGVDADTKLTDARALWSFWRAPRSGYEYKGTIA
ncbi:hypothetical protein OQA88_8411 [Cercophora sp. LCS_1]